MQVFPFQPADVPSVTDAVLYAVTRGGSYLNETGAKYLIGRGDVKVNEQPSPPFWETLNPGTYRIQVLDRVYHLQLDFGRVEG